MFAAASAARPVIKCTNDTSDGDTYDNIFFCASHNVSFVGVEFQGCGPVSSNVFFNDSTDILFDDCTFR